MRFIDGKWMTEERAQPYVERDEARSRAEIAERALVNLANEVWPGEGDKAAPQYLAAASRDSLETTDA